MTKLETISNNHISLFCRCGHSSMIAVKDLLKVKPPEMTIHQVAQKAKCRVCGAVGSEDFRLHYVCKTNE